ALFPYTTLFRSQVDLLQTHSVHEVTGRGLRGDHRMRGVDVVTDTESREFQDERAEVLSKGRHDPREVAPPGDSRARPVEKHERWPLTGFAVAERSVFCRQFLELGLVGRCRGSVIHELHVLSRAWPRPGFSRPAGGIGSGCRARVD